MRKDGLYLLSRTTAGMMLPSPTRRVSPIPPSCRSPSWHHTQHPQGDTTIQQDRPIFIKRLCIAPEVLRRTTTATSLPMQLLSPGSVHSHRRQEIENMAHEQGRRRTLWIVKSRHDLLAGAATYELLQMPSLCFLLTPRLGNSNFEIGAVSKTGD